MTLPQFADLAAYWRKYPPVHLLVRAALGIKGENGRTADLGDLLSEAGPGGIFATK